MERAFRWLASVAVTVALVASSSATAQRAGRGRHELLDAGTDAGDASVSADAGVAVDAGPLPYTGPSALDVAGASDATAAALRSTRDVTADSDGYQRAGSDYENARALIDELDRSPLLAHVEVLEPRALTDLRQGWRLPQGLLESALRTVDARSRALERAQDQLLPLLDAWNERITRIDEQTAPDEVRVVAVESRRTVVDELDRLAKLTKRARDLHDAVSTESLRVATVMERIADADQRGAARLWQRGSLPLFRAFRRSAARPSFASLIHETFAMHSELLRRGIRTELPGFGAALTLFGALLLTLFYQRHRSTEWEGDPEVIRLARHVVSAPTSSAMLITLLLTPAVVRTAPTIVYDVVFVALLVPVLRLLPPLVPLRVRSLIYGFAVVLVADRLVGLMPDGTPLHQTLVVAEGFGTAAWLLAWRRRHGNDEDKALHTVILVAGSILIAAATAGFLGWEALASAGVRATMTSVYVAMLMFAGALVAEAFGVFSLRTSLARKLTSVRRHRPLLTQRLRLGVRGGALVLWLLTTATIFRVLAPVRGAFHALMRVSGEIGSVHLSIGSVAACVAIIVGTGWIARLLRFILEEEVFSRLELATDVSGSASRLAGYGVMMLGALAALAALGIDSSQLAIVAGALSVGIGFGLQNIVSNFISGVILIAERPVKLGDFIEVGSLVGEVKRIGIRASTIQALDGAEVIVPNADLISKEVVNWTLSNRRRRISVAVGIAYGTDPHLARTIILDTCLELERVMKDPAPQVLFTGFGDSSLDLVAHCWVSDYVESQRLSSEITFAIHDALYQAGIEIPFPQRDLNLRTVDTRVAQALQGKVEPAS